MALHRHGHFGKAATECKVSQPTLSTLVAKAEEELGVTLFDRRTKPIAATAPGQALIALAQEVVLAHERLLAAAAGTSPLAGRLTLGVIPTLAPYVLPWLLEALSKQAPQLELTVVERGTRGLLRDLDSLQLDCAILATPLGEAALDTRVLFYDPFYVYAHQDSKLLAKPELRLRDIDREDLWLLQDGHCFRTQVVRLCGLHTRQVLPNVHFEAGSFETLRGLIDRSGGFTLVPETYARTLSAEFRRTRVRPFEDPIPVREVSLVSRRGYWNPTLLDAVAAVARAGAPRSLPRDLEQRAVVDAV